MQRMPPQGRAKRRLAPPLQPPLNKPGTRRSYVAADGGNKMPGWMAPETLDLAMGARVMLLKNLDPASKLVNGARGTVCGFAPACAAPDVSSAPAVVDAGADAAGAEGSSRGAAEAGEEGPPTGLYPVVRFDGTGIERLLTPEEWTVEQGGRVVARRVQVPCLVVLLVL